MLQNKINQRKRKKYGLNGLYVNVLIFCECLFIEIDYMQFIDNLIIL